MNTKTSSEIGLFTECQRSIVLKSIEGGLKYMQILFHFFFVLINSRKPVANLNAD